MEPCCGSKLFKYSFFCFAAGRLFLVMLALLVFALSLYLAHHAYSGRPITTDENSYVFQAGQFFKGTLRYDYPDLADCFKHEMIIMHPRHGWFSRYPPGHAAWLVPGVWLGYPRIMVALAATLTVLVLGVAANIIGLPVWLPGLLLAFSPFFLFGHGTLLSHSSAALASSLIIAGLLLWFMHNRTAGAVIAGLAWAWLFNNRTLSAIALVPLLASGAIFFLFYTFRRRGIRSLYGTALFAGCSAFGVLVYLAYNAQMTGDPLLPTYLLYAPSENLGFGWRYTHIQGINHTPLRGLYETWQNLLLLDSWLWGWHGALIVVLLLMLAGISHYGVSVLCFGAAFLSVVAGYIFFWYPGPREFGPGYYLDAAPFLYMACAAGGWALYRAACAKAGKVIIPVVALLFAGWLFCFVSFVSSQVIVRQDAAQLEARLAELLEQAPPRSLVVLKNVPQPALGQLVFNPDGLDSNPLIVRYIPDTLHLLARRFPDRDIYIVNRDSIGFEPLQSFDEKPRVCISPLDTHRLTGTNLWQSSDGMMLRAASEFNGDKAGYLVYGVTKWLAPGTNRVDFSVSGVGTDWSCRADVAVDAGCWILAETDIPDGENGVVTLVLVNNSFIRVEPRVYYGGCGRLVVHEICFEEIEKRSERCLKDIYDKSSYSH